ncbi:DNA polymerase III subunit gamma/tau, partial [Aquibium sp. A9E412]|uniref:DNA polymerase III subunit gamma/tau n=1 Tax=Aquibium sp. A9E412 TaxID=2976767 RepID=UPI0025AF3809
MDQAAEERKQAAGAAYRVLARKYRPSDFSALIGQEPMVRTLTNAFASGRIAQAWMLTGVRGVGKTTTARILARALNYKTDGVDQPTIAFERPGEHCQAILEGRHVDVMEMDAASHTGIDDIRDIIEQVRYAPVSARYKVYIIDEVHMLSNQAFNGLLKTLEEPPPHVKFIFATTEIRKVPITVLSRCQRFDLRRVDAGMLTAHLKAIADREGVEADDEAFAMIARAAEGSVRDSLSILDQAIAHSAGRVTPQTVRDMLGLADRSRVVDLFEHLMKGDVAAALAEFRAQYDTGADPAAVLTDLAEFNHLVTRLRFVPAAAEDASLSEEERRRGLAFADALSVRVLSRAWQMLLKGIAEVQASNRPVAAGEMVLIRIAHAADLPPLDEALKALEE